MGALNVPRRVTCRLGWVLALLAAMPAVFALDPSKTLTQYTHRVWQQEQGLPQPTVYAITQSHDGYLWLGTQGRLVRFDGVRFNEFDGVPGAAFGNLPIQALFEDQEHNLWIGSGGGGLTRLSGGVFTKYHGLPDESVNGITGDTLGNLWISTQRGLVQLGKSGMTVYTTAQGLPSDHVRAAVQGGDGTLWVAGVDFGLARREGGRFLAVRRESISQGGTRVLLATGRRTIWAGTDEGLFRFREGQVDHWTTRNGLPANAVLALAAGTDESIWIGTSAGVSRLKDGEFTHFLAKDGLSHSTVLSLFEDREGSLWAGTKNGLNQFLDGRVTPYTTQEGMPSNDVGPVYEDRGGQLWVGTLDAGLARFDGHHFTVLTTQDGLPSNSIYTLAEDQAGDLWVGTGRGLARLQAGVVTATYTTRDGLPSDRIDALFKDTAGVLWIGTAEGLARLEGGRFLLVKGGDLGTKRILSLGGGLRVRLFVATADGGLTYLKDGAFTRSQPKVSSEAPAVSFYAAPDHLLWVGTLGGGLRRYQDGKVTVYSTAEGLFDDQIYATLPDGERHVWMASSKGIFRTDQRELDELASGKRASVNSYPLNTGGVRFECRTGVQPLAVKTRDGKLWFSTDHGLILVDPERVRRDGQAPPIWIRDVMVNNREAGEAELARLRPAENNLEFRYVSLSFTAPERVTFRYMLEGYDRAWRDARNQRIAWYTNLPPGHFRFHVTACNADGICNEAGSAAKFTIVPYFYQRSWFYPTLAAIVMWMGWLAYRLRVRYLEHRFTLVVAERTRIARELHDTLLQGLSSITMQMQALSNRMPSSSVKQTLDDIIQDAGSCLKEARKSLWGLRSKETGASRLPERIGNLARQIVDGRGIRLELEIGQDFGRLAPEIESHLARIAQEALTNAVLHAGARSIEVSLRRLPDGIELAVADDGGGFQPEQPAAPGHYGLVGVRERVVEMGGDLKIESEPGKGTKLRVRIPDSGVRAPGSKAEYAYNHSPLR